MLTEIVRVISRSPTGSTASGSLSGPAKMERKATLRRIGQATDAPVESEFEIEPTGTGTIHFKVTMTAKDAATPEVVTYTINVK